MATYLGLSDHLQASIYRMKLHSMRAYIMGPHIVDSNTHIFKVASNDKYQPEGGLIKRNV